MFITLKQIYSIIESKLSKSFLFANVEFNVVYYVSQLITFIYYSIYLFGVLCACVDDIVKYNVIVFDPGGCPHSELLPILDLFKYRGIRYYRF